MLPFPTLLALFLAMLIAVTTSARANTEESNSDDPTSYWRTATNNQPLPEALQDLIPSSEADIALEKKTHNHFPQELEKDPNGARLNYLRYKKDIPLNNGDPKASQKDSNTAHLDYLRYRDNQNMDRPDYLRYKNDPNMARPDYLRYKNDPNMVRPDYLRYKNDPNMVRLDYLRYKNDPNMVHPDYLRYKNVPNMVRLDYLRYKNDPNMVRPDYLRYKNDPNMVRPNYLRYKNVPNMVRPDYLRYKNDPNMVRPDYLRYKNNPNMVRLDYLRYKNDPNMGHPNYLGYKRDSLLNNADADSEISVNIDYRGNDPNMVRPDYLRYKNDLNMMRPDYLGYKNDPNMARPNYLRYKNNPNMEHPNYLRYKNEVHPDYLQYKNDPNPVNPDYLRYKNDPNMVGPNYLRYKNGPNMVNPDYLRYKNDPNMVNPDYLGYMRDSVDPSLSSKVEYGKLLVFLPSDLYVGKKFLTIFPSVHSSSGSQFASAKVLPKHVAESIPFSSTHLPDILKGFGIQPDSPWAKSVEETLKSCEGKETMGETLFCATSLESMLDSVRNTIGSNSEIHVISTTHLTKPSSKDGSIEKPQKYTLLEAPKEIEAPKKLNCHPMTYLYPIFGCHSVKDTKVYRLLLEGEDKSKVDAVAVCHMDTSDWSSDALFLVAAGLKPGDGAVCHFMQPSHFSIYASSMDAKASV